MQPVDLAAHFTSRARAPEDVIGRSRELEQLAGALESALAGTGKVVLVAGEPGIGKTRLAEVLAAEARARGCTVAWGSCWESGGAPAHWPWIQVLRSLTGDVGPHELSELLGRNARGLCALVPELRERLGALAPPPLDSGESDGARFTAWDATASFLGGAARDGLLVVIDDAHAADLPSLLVLSFLARNLHDRRVLVLATLRDQEAAAHAELFDEIGRAGARVALRGLSEAALAELVTAGANRPAPAAFTRELRRVTEGNPLFALEVLRLRLAEADGDPFALPVVLPPTVGAALVRRFDGLAARDRELLGVAAVAGRRIDVTRTAELAGVSESVVTDAVDAAERAGLVAVHLDERRFSHALVREALYESLAPERRRELHAAMVDALTRGGGAPLTVLAHHAALAGVPEAPRYARAAGDVAVAGLAFEAAAAHYEQALAGAPRDADLLLALADALMRSGETVRARERFADAAGVARSTGNAQQLASAALGFGSGGEMWANGGVDEELAALLEEALTALPADAAEQRALVLARLADVLLYRRDRERTAALTEEAIAEARASGEASALTRAIEARLLARLCPATLDERMALAHELASLADASGVPERTLGASTWLMTFALERGDRAEVDSRLASFRNVAEQQRQPHMLWTVSLQAAMLALLEGRLADAERLAHEAFAVGASSVPLAQQMFGAQMLGIRREQGRLAELEPGLRAMVQAFPEVHSWRISWVGMLIELGMEDRARAELDGIAERDFLLAPDDYEWISATALLAESFARVGDRERCAVLRERLEPYADRHVVVSIGVSYMGAVARYLGLLAEAMGDADAAAGHFEAAIGAQDGLGAAGYATRTRYEYGRLLIHQGRDGTALLRAAADTGDRLGLGVAAAARALLDEHSRRDAPAPASAVFSRAGDGWAIGDPVSPVRLSHARGLEHIAALLRRPGVPVPALQLAGGTATGDAGPLLDDAALGSYRRRLAELETELDEAERWSDPERAEGIRGEIEALTGELSAATGLGGRTRRTGSSAERARVSVTKAIRASLARIADADPAVGDYLKRSIRTGSVCSYEPPVNGALRWLLD
jgi:tetratricopeptide (TPR) repeat protein